MTFSGLLARCAVALLAVATLASCAKEEPRGPVVLAASSMQEALTDVAAAWTEQGHPAPVLSFAATSALVRQVEQGAPADIAIAADAEWMHWLEERKLVDPASIRVLGANALVLVSADPAQGEQTIADSLAGLGNGRLAIADPQSVPAGRYAREALEGMFLWDDVEDRIVPAENVRAALALVESGEADLGIVYATDARASQRVRVVATFAAADTPAILYPAALIADAPHADAQAFLDFLSSSEAQTIFAEHGFLPPGQGP